MTDHFARLDQPRLPFLDLSALETAYRDKARLAHPDAGGAAAAEFQGVNEAYEVLRDPRRRLQHLLALEAGSPLSVSPDDAELNLFAEIARVANAAKFFLEQDRATTSAISRSVAAAQRADLRSEIEAALGKVLAASTGCEKTLRALNQIWAEDRAAAVHVAAQLQQRFTFLGRWTGTLNELRFRLEH